MQELGKKSSVKETILVLLLYMVLYLFYFNIQFKNFSTSLLNDGRYFDILQVYWNTWHFSFQLKQFTNPFISDFQLYPQSYNLWMHAYTPFLGLLNLLCNNPVLAINIGLFIVFIVGSYFAYCLTALFLENKAYRFLASTFYMFNFYTINKIGIHYNLILICIAPILIYSMLKAITISEHKISFTKKYVIQSILLILVNFLFDYYALFYALSFIILYLFYFSFLEQWLAKFNWKKSVLLISFFLVMHIIVRLLRIAGFTERGALWSAADFRSYFLASSSSYPEWLNLPVSLLSEHSLFLGYTLLISFLLALVIKKGDGYTRFFVFAIIVYAMVSAPVFRINNKDLFFFPTGIIHFIPFVNNVRNPSRFLEMMFLLMPIFVFRKIEIIQPKLNYWWIVIIFFLTSYEQKIYAKSYLKVKEFNTKSKIEFASSYAIKDKLPAGSGILTIPFGIKDGFEQWGDFDEEIYVEQSIHQFKVSSGYYSRIKKDIWEKYQSDNFYKSLVLAQKDSVVSIPTQEQVQQFIINNNITAVYIRTNYIAGKNNLWLFVDGTFPKEKYRREVFDNRILIFLK